MKAEIRYSRNIYDKPYLSLWITNGMEIECAWGNTWLSAFWRLCKRMYTRGTLKCLFKVRKFIKW